MKKYLHFLVVCLSLTFYMKATYDIFGTQLLSCVLFFDNILHINVFKLSNRLH